MISIDVLLVMMCNDNDDDILYVIYYTVYIAWRRKYDYWREERNAWWYCSDTDVTKWRREIQWYSSITWRMTKLFNEEMTLLLKRRR